LETASVDHSSLTQKGVSSIKKERWSLQGKTKDKMDTLTPIGKYLEFVNVQGKQEMKMERGYTVPFRNKGVKE